MDEEPSELVEPELGHGGAQMSRKAARGASIQEYQEQLDEGSYDPSGENSMSMMSSE